LRHDSATALLFDGHLTAAMEESKLVRSPGIGGIPREAIRFCLDRADIGEHQVDYVAIASRPLHAWARQSWLRARLAPVAPFASLYYESRAIGNLGRELNYHRRVRLMWHDSRTRVFELEHSLCHAASAFFGSPYDRALVLVLDEQGDGWSGLVAVGEDNHIRVLRAVPFPHSLGWVYSQVTQLLGFLPHKEEHKTQWLSLEGTASRENLFLDVLRRGPDPWPRLDMSYFRRGLRGRPAFSKKFYRRAGAPGGESAVTGDLGRQLASDLQEACAIITADLAEEMRKQTGAKHLCLAGGVFLNGPLVAALEERTGFEQVFAHPAAGNPGTALGAAAWVWHQLVGKPRTEPLRNLYLGPSYSNAQIKEILHNCKAYYHWCDTEAQMTDAVIQLLKAGKIVAWFQGPAEFGPRALGNRSLLASPWSPYVKNNLNDYIKRREKFRPFAIAVPEEDAAHHFDFAPSTCFMASLGHVRPESRGLLQDFLLPHNTLRLQVVARDTNPMFWKLLKRFGESQAAPFLVNTSFNLFGEPLVVTPRDAVRSYFSSGVDAMLIGNFLLSKDSFRI
jgi:carbamoyltransferase